MCRVQKQNYITGLILIGYALEIAKADASLDIKVINWLYPTLVDGKSIIITIILIELKQH